VYCSAILFSMGHATTLQFYHSFFFSVLHSGYTISLFFCSNTFSPIVSLLLYFIHYTLVISSFFTFFFFPYFLAEVTLHVFYLFFEKKSLLLVFVGLDFFAFTFSTIHIHCYYLFYQSFSLKQKCTFWRYALLLIIFLCFFLYRIYWFFSCCVFCGLAICIAFFSLFFLFSTIMFGCFYL